MGVLLLIYNGPAYAQLFTNISKHVLILLLTHPLKRGDAHHHAHTNTQSPAQTHARINTQSDSQTHTLTNTPLCLLAPYCLAKEV